MRTLTLIVGGTLLIALGLTPLGASDPPKPAPAVEAHYSTEALQIFTRRVQPLLLNSCGAVACHGGTTGGDFALLRPPNIGQFTAPMTRQNISQALARVDPDNPDASALLRKALEAHGGAKRPPLAGRDTPAYKTLADWVHKTVPKKAEEPAPTPAFPPRPAESRPPAVEEKPMLPAPMESPAAVPSTAPPTPVDPFDPVIFNSQYHPGRR